MAAELDRIGTVVGEGKITQRASLGSAGSWTACVDSVNTLITDLVQPTAETARVIRAVANGDLSQTIAPSIEGRPLKGSFSKPRRSSTLWDQLSSFASGDASSGWLLKAVRCQAEIRGGAWKDLMTLTDGRQPHRASAYAQEVASDR